MQDRNEAKKKIGYFHFLVMTGLFFIGYTFVASILGLIIFQGEEFLFMFVISSGLVFSYFVLTYGFIKYFKPNQKLYLDYVNQLSLYYAKKQTLKMPPNVMIYRVFTHDETLGLIPNVLYFVWNDHQKVHFFPYKPHIEAIEYLIEKQIKFEKHSVLETDILTINDLGNMKYKEFTYENRKKHVTEKQLKTVELVLSNQTKIIIDETIKLMFEKPTIVAQEEKQPLKQTSVQQRLEQLKVMHENKLITDDEYETKRKALLDEL